MTRFVDLTFPISEGMQTFPVHWHPMVEITQLGRLGVEGRETRKLVLGTHTGTHMDAPRHFIEGGKTLDQIELQQLNGPASVVDLSHLADKTEVSADMLKEAIGDRPKTRLVLRYDWCRQFGSKPYYTDHPFLAEEAVQWLADEGCKLLAMDTPMPDNPKNGSGSEKDSPCHHIFLGNGGVLVEYLANIKDIQQPEVFLVVAPLKIHGSDGAPVRCFAIEGMPS